MKEITLEGLDALIQKALQLQEILTRSPEIVEYLRLAEKFADKEVSVIPIPTDRLIRTGEAAKILNVSKQTVDNYAKKKILTPLYTAVSSHKKFWLSEVKKLPSQEELVISNA